MYEIDRCHLNQLKEPLLNYQKISSFEEQTKCFLRHIGNNEALDKLIDVALKFEVVNLILKPKTPSLSYNKA